MLTRSEPICSEKGSALLTVLWLTAALSAVGIAVAANVRSETERTATSSDEVRAYFAARGAIERTALRFFWGDPYFVYGTPVVAVDFPEAVVRVEIIPETAKLNVNDIGLPMLVRLLLALGEPEERAREVAAAIVDWRTPATLQRPGLFDGFYLSQTPSFLPRHTSFQENEEILLVRGMTSELYYGKITEGGQGLRDCLSVFGGSAPEVNTAAPATMVAAGLSPEAAAAIVRRRNVRPFVTPQEIAELQKELGPQGRLLSFGGGSMYTLKATARPRLTDGRLSDMQRTVAALIKLHQPGNKKNMPVGHEVLNWYDRW